MESGETAVSVDVERLLGDRGRLLALARRLAGDDDAEDLVQETSLRAWLHPPGDAARARGWLRRIAQNLAARRHVRAAARVARERSVAAREAQPAADALVAQVELQRALADALLALDEPHRCVVLLRFWEQLPPRAIAARLELPVETVRTRQKRALARLRERLDARYGSRDSWGITAWTAGAAAMGGATKTAVAAGVVLALGLAGWQVARTVGREEIAPNDAVAASGGAVASASVEDERDGAATPSAAAASDATPTAQRTTADGAAAPRFARAELRGVVVEESGGAAIAEAKVALHWFERTDDGGTVDRTLDVTTDAEGRFAAVAERVAIDFFDATATHARHARVAASKQATETHGEDADARAVVDFGRLEMAVGARIVGRVVTLPERSAVAGAEISLGIDGWYGAGTFQLDSARPIGAARDDGRFELAERIVAERSAAVLYAFGAGRIGFALFRTTGSADAIEVEIGLEPPGALDVTVVDPDGAPVADAEVIAYPAFAPFGARDYRSGLPPLPTLARQPWKSLFSGVTDEAGVVRFATLPEGRADPLFLAHPGHVQSYQLHVVAAGWPRAFESVLVARGTSSASTVKLLPPTVHRIVGRVLRSGSGAPIAGATIELDGYPPAFSGADGRYATGDQPGPIGSLDGRVTADGYAPADCGATRDWVRRRITTTAIEGAVASGVAPDDAPRAREEYVVDFELAPAATVSGRVVDDAGEPVAGVLVRVEGLVDDGSRFVSLDAKGGATGADGRFEVAGVAGDGGEATVEPPDGWLAPFAQHVRPGQSDVELVVQRLPASTARAVVKVRDATSGEAVTPARAYAWPRSTEVRSRPGATIGDGEITVEQLFPGDWDLRVELGDGRRALLPFRVTTLDEQLALELRVGSEAIVEGQLLFEGKPLRPKGDERWWIWARAATNDNDDAGHALDAEGRPVSGLTGSVAVADEEGRFVMARLLPGVAIRFAIEGEQQRASATVVLQPGERRKLSLELVPSATVEWRMGESLPAGRIVLELARGDEPLCREETRAVDAVGSLLGRSSRPAGLLRWRATWTASRGLPPEQRVATGTLDLAAGATATIDVTGFR